jgi:hypothetical protein
MPLICVNSVFHPWLDSFLAIRFLSVSNPGVKLTLYFQFGNR